MRFLFAIGVLAAALAAPATAQTVGGGDLGLKGKIVSKTVTAPATTSVPILVTDTKGFFVLTQVCTADASAGDEAVVEGSATGLLATDRQTCRGYSPGIVFSPGETVACNNTANAFPLVCTISGVQVAK